VRAAAALLAALHHPKPPRAHVRALSQYRRLVTRMARRVARHGMLDAATATRLATIPLPQTMTLACTHGDLSPQNLVVTSEGELRAIDVERLAVRDIAFDLARVAQLWPLTKARERAFIDAYAAAGGCPDSYLEHRMFWTAVALSTSLSFRWKRRPRDVPPLLARLRALVATKRRGRAA
jgi:thiamine kinase-like enzyme